MLAIEPKDITPIHPWIYVGFTIGMLLIGAIVSWVVGGLPTRRFARAFPYAVLAIAAPLFVMALMAHLTR